MNLQPTPPARQSGLTIKLSSGGASVSLKSQKLIMPRRLLQCLVGQLGNQKTALTP